MVKKNVVPVDHDKLAAEIKRRGYSMQDFGPAIGLSRNYFGGVIREKSNISMPVVMLLETKFNIKYDDIKPDEPAAEPEPEAQTEMEIPDDMQRQIHIMADALRMVIYPEVKRAIIDAMNE